MDLQAYMEQGVKLIRHRVGRYYLNNPDGRRFLRKFVPALNKSARLRAAQQRRGIHVPQFLICSITSKCNLHCAGCYARAGGTCSDAVTEQLDATQWEKVFAQAEEMGISFILLAGGEPLMRQDVLETAARFPAMAFPVFTNGTLLTGDMQDWFDVHRNMIPVLSIEGDAAATDARRGAGVWEKLDAVMAYLQERGILFAASTTVTRENMRSVATPEYLDGLRVRGCGIAFFIEYVPAEPGTEDLVLTKTEADWLNQTTNALREAYSDLCLFSFPGDEQYTEGCLAAGRGFFHINPNGGAEPCPFSPYSKLNVRTSTLSEVLESEYFSAVRRISQSETGHNGGCTLFAHEQEIRAL